MQQILPPPGPPHSSQLSLLLPHTPPCFLSPSPAPEVTREMATKDSPAVVVHSQGPVVRVPEHHNRQRIRIGVLVVCAVKLAPAAV